MYAHYEVYSIKTQMVILTQLKDFVKHNTVEGWVELELCSGRGKNWVVRRLLSCDANTSSWMLNGKEVPKKDVSTIHM